MASRRDPVNTGASLHCSNSQTCADSHAPSGMPSSQSNTFTVLSSILPSYDEVTSASGPDRPPKYSEIIDDQLVTDALTYNVRNDSCSSIFQYSSVDVMPDESNEMSTSPPNYDTINT